jgi:hypothetical protein
LNSFSIAIKRCLLVSFHQSRYRDEKNQKVTKAKVIAELNRRALRHNGEASPG